MYEQKKALVYERNSEHDKNGLPSYQIDSLPQYTHKNDYLSFESVRLFDLDNSLESIFIQYLIKSILYKFINCSLAYSINRLTINPSKLEKLKLIYRIHNVSFIAINQ